MVALQYLQLPPLPQVICLFDENPFFCIPVETPMTATGDGNNATILFLYDFSGDTATCLFNAPHEDDALPRVLPGKLLTLDAQCRKDRGTSACFVSTLKTTKSEILWS